MKCSETELNLQLFAKIFSSLDLPEGQDGRKQLNEMLKTEPNNNLFL